MRLLDSQRSPMYLSESISGLYRHVRMPYITTPLTEIKSAVWELNVSDPAVAKVFHADQGPLRLVAVVYMLSLGAVSQD